MHFVCFINETLNIVKGRLLKASRCLFTTVYNFWAPWARVQLDWDSFYSCRTPPIFGITAFQTSNNKNSCKHQRNLAISFRLAIKLKLCKHKTRWQVHLFIKGKWYSSDRQGLWASWLLKKIWEDLSYYIGCIKRSTL